MGYINRTLHLIGTNADISNIPVTHAIPTLPAAGNSVYSVHCVVNGRFQVHRSTFRTCTDSANICHQQLSDTATVGYV